MAVSGWLVSHCGDTCLWLGVLCDSAVPGCSGDLYSRWGRGPRAGAMPLGRGSQSGPSSRANGGAFSSVRLAWLVFGHQQTVGPVVFPMSLRRVPSGACLSRPPAFDHQSRPAARDPGCLCLPRLPPWPGLLRVLFCIWGWLHLIPSRALASTDGAAVSRRPSASSAPTERESSIDLGQTWSCSPPVFGDHVVGVSWDCTLMHLCRHA